MNYWLAKSEPSTYSWDDLVRDKGTAWTGIRNFQARNFLRAMKKGDLVFFYHTGDVKAVVGIAKVARAPYADPTAKEGDWSAIDLAPVKPLKRSLPLAELKKQPAVKNMVLLHNSRLSLQPVTATEWTTLINLAA